LSKELQNFRRSESCGGALKFGPKSSRSSENFTDAGSGVKMYSRSDSGGAKMIETVRCLLGSGGGSHNTSLALDVMYNFSANSGVVMCLFGLLCSARIS